MSGWMVVQPFPKTSHAEHNDNNVKIYKIFEVTTIGSSYSLSTRKLAACSHCDDDYQGLWGISSYSCQLILIPVLLLSSGTQMRCRRKRLLRFRLLLLVRKLSVSLIVCINWRLESHLRGTRTIGTTLSFRSTATCNCCNSQDISPASRKK